MKDFKNKENNIAFIDGQNLYMSIYLTYPSWQINLKKLNVYLKDKYNVNKSFYFLGYKIKKYNNIYKKIIKSGFILKFRKHNKLMTGLKKGNVDSDIIFYVMKLLYYNANFNKIIIISGDGDYKLLIDFLIQENKFKKIIFPNKKFASSLYKKLGSEYYDYLENIKNKVDYKKKTP